MTADEKLRAGELKIIAKLFVAAVLTRRTKALDPVTYKPSTVDASIPCAGRIGATTTSNEDGVRVTRAEFQVTVRVQPGDIVTIGAKAITVETVKDYDATGAEPQIFEATGRV